VCLNLDTLTPDRCTTLFFFEKDDLIVIICVLCSALRIPQELVASNRTCCTGMEGFYILLRRLAYPNRLKDLEEIFGRGVSELSVIVNLVLVILYDSWHHLLVTLPAAWLTTPCLQEVVDVVLKLCMSTS
jgi:hypothetical protein